MIISGTNHLLLQFTSSFCSIFWHTSCTFRTINESTHTHTSNPTSYDCWHRCCFLQVSQSVTVSHMDLPCEQRWQTPKNLANPYNCINFNKQGPQLHWFSTSPDVQHFCPPAIALRVLEFPSSARVVAALLLAAANSPETMHPQMARKTRLALGWACESMHVCVCVSIQCLQFCMSNDTNYKYKLAIQYQKYI